MTVDSTTLDTPVCARFRHEAALYDGQAELVDGVAAFLHEAVAAGEPVCAMLPQATLAAVHERLGETAEHDDVVLADMSEVGRNPGRIISAWHDFVVDHGAGARPLRGVGQPVWADRSPEELTECLHHEELLNIAFDGSLPMWLICPYDTATLPSPVIAAARTCHPFVSADGASPVDPEHEHGPPVGAGPDDAPLRPPPDDARSVPIAREDLAAVRRAVRMQAAAAGLARSRTAALALAASELATNSVRHGGGRGTLTSWSTPDAVVLEVRDAGHIDQPLVGRFRPDGPQPQGRGLWLVHQVCDLVQLRSSAAGTVVRVTMRHDAAR
jgi:anti-sigma regulatory factor (Ser/Thr protein kinase)